MIYSALVLNNQFFLPQASEMLTVLGLLELKKLVLFFSSSTISPRQ
ncbi:hypothetical protein LDG_6534 [Legionella drancourtii LLAP12]|uniref:Uncharacterized protein n=1 Tax=Legionella drancourtii LLAP12 TaxID=658187 RepID=G9EMR4_9GAMM|nr:hypothetical protein LDG_6534 [Legionella drancourtii LLAP12]